MSANYRSRYEQSWQELKRNKRIQVRFKNASLAPRFIKAIRKRKNLDLAYRFALTSQNKKDRLSWKFLTTDSSILEINLTISSISISDSL